MKYPLFLAAALLLAACNNDKKAEVGTEGMNAAATAESDAANPTIDNPNVVNESEAPNPNAPVMKFAEA